MTKHTHAELVKLAMQKPGVKKAYEELEDEFQLLDEMLKARTHAGKTQADVARSMNTTTSVVGRLETGGGQYSHSPKIATLRKYAEAVNCHLEVRFVKKDKKEKIHNR